MPCIEIHQFRAQLFQTISTRKLKHQCFTGVKIHNTETLHNTETKFKNGIETSGFQSQQKHMRPMHPVLTFREGKAGFQQLCGILFRKSEDFLNIISGFTVGNIAVVFLYGPGPGVVRSQRKLGITAETIQHLPEIP